MSYELPYFEGNANCKGLDTEEFFADDSTYANHKTIQAICDNCEVLDQCLDYALHVKVLGFWGGTTDHQRVALRKEFGIVPETIGVDYLTGGLGLVDMTGQG